MDFERIRLFTRTNIVPIALGSVGLLLILFGLFQSLSRSNQSPLVFEEGEVEAKEELTVDVEGAVINPGVYKLSSKSRIVDALAASGGLSEDADRDFVEKNVNLAQKVSDGLKIYIPRLGEQVLSKSSLNSDTTGPVLNINTAGSSELESLPGIGPVTASKIIDNRPYGQIDDLLTKKIIGQATYDKIKDKISAN